MRLAIVRHGKAEAGFGSDFDRDLRPEGERQAGYLRDRLGGVVPRIDAIVSSRAVRARRTAEIIADGSRVDFDDRLLVDEPVSGVLDLIRERGASAGLVLVGHNPQCGGLAAVLTGGVASVPGPVRTGEAVVLDVDPGDLLGHGVIVDRLRLGGG